MGKGKGNLVAETITKLERLGAVLGLGSRAPRRTTGQEELTVRGRVGRWSQGGDAVQWLWDTAGEEENVYTAAQRSLEMVKQSDETVGVAVVSFFSDQD